MPASLRTSVVARQILPPTALTPLPLQEQITLLAALADVDPHHAFKVAKAVERRSLPPGAEGYVAILNRLVSCPPRWSKITAAPRRITERTAAGLERLAQKQPGDIQIVAAQTGAQRTIRSLAETQALLPPDEYECTLGIGLAIVYCHPERLGRHGTLDIILSGEQLTGDGLPWHFPSLHYRREVEMLPLYGLDWAHGGVATWWIPPL